MYSNKENINILVSLLLKHGVTNAVVCPGSRNAAIIHDLYESGIRCYPVTDERSAGFFALGMAQAVNEPVVVCVTSGTALLDVAPAVAEATYQHNGIIVISADRSGAWIEQNDGQTLPQPGALTSFVGKCVNISEPHTDEERWHVNRLVNEALIEVNKRHRPSVHINVPLAQPLFEYTTEILPQERKIMFQQCEATNFSLLQEAVKFAKRPMIVMGQTNEYGTQLEEAEAILLKHFVMVKQANSCLGNIYHADEILYSNGKNEDYQPDLVIQMGGDIVSKRVKEYIRNLDCEVWSVTEDGQVHDTFVHTEFVIEGSIAHVINGLAELLKDEEVPAETTEYIRRWESAEGKVSYAGFKFQPAYSQMAVIKKFENSTTTFYPHVHYANSSAIRLANIYAFQRVWCNRGVNGIDGSVSTAAGFSVALPDTEMVFLVTGDLSFFYDQNALWNNNLRNNFRILLLNNGEGGIFRQVKDFGKNPMAVGKHKTTAEGICAQNNVSYHCAHNMKELDEELKIFMRDEDERPMLLEVFTNAATDSDEYKRYYHSLNL